MNPFEQIGTPLKEATNETENTDEEIFQSYVEDLDLKPEDFNKKILDIGSAGAQFAKYAKEHHIANEIYSVEPAGELLEKSKSVKAKAEKLPFKDKSFDLITSLHAVPNIYVVAEYARRREDILGETFQEMLRVLQVGGEIRLGGVALENDKDEYKQNYFKALAISLDRLKQDRSLVVSLKEKTHNQYLICVKKLE